MTAGFAAGRPADTVMPQAMTGTAAQLTLPLGWSQRWRDGRHSWRHLHEGGFDRRQFECAPFARATEARAFVEQHHYARSWPAATIAFGMHQDGELVGVAVLGVPVRREVLTGPFPDLVPFAESIELARFVLLDRVPANAETHMLGQLFRYLRSETCIRGVLAFSDPYPRRTRAGVIIMPGHWGTIYQAKSAFFLGRSRRRRITMLPDGTVLNDRAGAKLVAGDQGWRYVVDRLVALGATAPTVSTCPGRPWLEVALREVGAARIPHGGNFRYAFRLNRRVRIGMPHQAYPKRHGH